MTPTLIHRSGNPAFSDRSQLANLTRRCRLGSKPRCRIRVFTDPIDCGPGSDSSLQAHTSSSFFRRRSHRAQG